MLLSDLNTLFDELIDQGRLPPQGFTPKPVRFTVELDGTGRVVGATDAGTDRFEQLVPTIGRSGLNPPATPVTDNGKFVLGLPKTMSEKDQAGADRSHGQYLERLAEARDALADVPELVRLLDAVTVFARDPGARSRIEQQLGVVFEPNPKGEYVEASALFRFRVHGSDPTEHSRLRAWWATQVEGKLGSGDHGVCQVTGVEMELARIMPRLSIKQGKEALVSANFAAAERYDASQSGGARIGVDTAIRTHQALNWLLSDPNHRRRVGALTFAWWLVDDLAFDPFSNVVTPDPAVVASQFAAPWKGRPGVGADETLFRLVVLSLTEARVVVRADHTIALSDLQARLRSWFTLIELPRRDGTTWYPSLDRLAAATVAPGKGNARAAQRDRMVATLTETVLTGRPLPASVLSAAVRRCRAESHVSPERAALLRLCRSATWKEGLVPESESAGMLCGRVLAQLEWAQYAALGDTNRTIVDRYYAAASATPQRVFPGLLRGAQAHLSKARRQHKKGLEVVISRRLGELADLLATAGGFPATLATPGQADFALGYWQERQTRFTSKVTDDTSEQEHA
jgi:CRISPR-associated protein Csd1